MISNKTFKMIADNPGGNAGAATIFDAEDGSIAELAMHLDVRNHSPTGFAWGYGGSGPAQLALAILLEVTQDLPETLRLYHDFKFDIVVARTGDWQISEEYVRGWLAGRQRRDNLDKFGEQTILQAAIDAQERKGDGTS